MSLFRLATRLRHLALVTGIGLLAAAPAGHAQPSTQPWTQASSPAWPSKPLRFIVPYPPGGPLDLMARALAAKLRPALGQSVIVENRAGAGGNIGADIAAKAAPDGYTLVMGAVATHAINPWLYAKMPYDPVKDFAPITLVAAVPNVLVLNTGFAATNQIASVADLIAYGKQHPGRLNYGSGGNGSAGHLAGELLKARSGLDALHIPYQGAAPAQLALLAGQSDFMFDNLAAAAPLIKDGKVRALAVTTLERAALLADVPTLDEAGVKGFDLGTWFGVFATGGTPPDVVAKLNQAYSDALRQPDMVERLRAMGSQAQPLSAAAFARMVEQENAKYGEIVKLSGASIQ